MSIRTKIAIGFVAMLVIVGGLVAFSGGGLFQGSSKILFSKPSTIRIVTPINGAYNAVNPQIVVSGVAKANSTVSIFNGNAKMGETAADVKGNFSFRTPALPRGDYNFKAQDNKGDTSTVVKVTVDAIARITTPTAGTYNTAGVMVIEGDAPAGAAAELLDGNRVIGTFQPTPSGHFSYSVPSVAAGAHRFSIRAGALRSPEVAIQNTLSITIDRPAAGVYATADSPTVVAGRGPAGSTLQFFDNNVAIGRALVDKDGRYSYGTPRLSGGTHVLRVEGAGRVTAEVTLHLRGNLTISKNALRDPQQLSLTFRAQAETISVRTLSVLVEGDASTVYLAQENEGQLAMIPGTEEVPQTLANGRKVARFESDAAQGLFEVTPQNNRNVVIIARPSRAGRTNPIPSLYFNTADAQADFQMVRINSQGQSHDAATEANNGITDGSITLVQPYTLGANETILSNWDPRAAAAAPVVQESNAVLTVSAGEEIVGPDAGIPSGTENVALANIRLSAADGAVKVTKLTAVAIQDEDSIRAGGRNPFEQLFLFEGDRPVTNANGVGFRGSVGADGKVSFIARAQGATELFTVTPGTTRTITVRGTPAVDTRPGTRVYVGFVVTKGDEVNQIEAQADNQTFNDEAYAHIHFGDLSDATGYGDYTLGGNRLGYSRPARAVLGTMTISLDGSTPATRQISANEAVVGQPTAFTSIRFVADREPITVNALSVVNTAFTGLGETRQMLTSVALYDGNAQLTNHVSFDGNDVAHFQNDDETQPLFTVYPNQPRVITIKGYVSPDAILAAHGTIRLGIYINEEDLINSFNPRRFDIYISRVNTGMSSAEIDGANNRNGVTEPTTGINFTSNGFINGDLDMPYIGGNEMTITGGR
ncbi:hypothetical protein KBD59_02870 [Candidatus Gracilibacteria bacterium]|nr:hypothetical protein [Candidatus Gracilibacteria bacterium]